MTWPFETLIGEAIFSFEGSRVMEVDHVSVRDREFLNRPIGRGGVDELAVGIGGRGAVGDLRRAHEGTVAGRRESP